MSKEVRTIGIVGTGIIATSLAVLTTGHGSKRWCMPAASHRQNGA